MSLIIFFSALALSFVQTAAMRRYAVARNLVDVPGSRSSHQVPTPRGGGLAIVITIVVSIVCLFSAGMLDYSVALSLGGAGLIAALIGFWDDHGHVPARWRLLGHFVAAGWGLFWLGGLPPVVLWGATWELGWIGHISAAVFLVWLLNLYNFMDGINGVASVEAITVTVGGGILLWASLELVHPVFIAITGAVTGFLVWNFPRARIFMGDACSGFLGLLLGLIAIWQTKLIPELFAAWMILLGVFIVDATVTLCRRVLRGDKFYEAHRSHAYQFASRQLGTHTPVTLAVGVINLFWLLPLALMVALGILPGILALLIAFAPLIFLAFYYKAGARDLQEEN